MILFLVVAGFLFSAFPAKAAPVCKDIDPCTAVLIVQEILDYLVFQGTPEFYGFTLGQAIELHTDGSLMVSTTAKEFDNAYSNIYYAAEQGTGKKLLKYFFGAEGRWEFVKILEAAGWTQGQVFSTSLGVYQNKWSPPEGGMKPCNQPLPTPQQGLHTVPEPVRVDIPAVNPPPSWWTNLVAALGPVGLLLLGLLGLGFVAFALSR